MQAPMVSCPLKQTNEIDWVQPLKNHIRSSYGDDPEKYTEECATLNRLRQDMRGASKDTAAGRDLLYRYYGQLELLDLRFPVDENHIKILFTWFDAFTHKPTSQHSLAFEKASIIFNIAAVLTCYAAAQNRSEEVGLKTAYHSFQAAAGMFTYINDNFLHAPSTDLNHDTVRTLITIMLAQAQEVFMERQINDNKKPALLAKLASQAAYLQSQAVEGVQENVQKAVFEKPWLILTQVKASRLASLAQYHQALTDSEAGQHGHAVARLQVAERLAKEASKFATSFPNSPSANSNLGTETGPTLVESTKKNLSTIQEKLAELIRDNDFIYHMPVTSEASLPAIAKLPAAKAITVAELYQGQDVNRIIGPDIFQRIVPMSVTESASLYDEEKAKLIRAETERVETANGEMVASLDYLKLPASLNILKGGAEQELGVDEEFKTWCDELAGHAPFTEVFERLATDKQKVINLLDQCSQQLDMEESVCEKMRSKYGADWTQQPSSRLTSTLRSDIRNYHGAIQEAATSDAQLQSTLRTHEADFEEMRSAGETDEADVLYQHAMIKAGASRGKDSGGSKSSGATEGNLLDDDFDDSTQTVAERIAQVEDILRKLNLIKRERAQTLKDLKEKIHTDDISQILILNKKAITNQEHQLFKAELEKFKPYQTRILQANHKQSSVMKNLTLIYGALLQDKRVKSEQTKYETFSRQKNSVMTKYRRSFQAFNDLNTGLERAQGFYSEMKDTVENLFQNVETFVSNRKAEGGELLSQIEKNKSSPENARERLTELMDRMNMSDARGSSRPGSAAPNRPAPLQNIPTYQHQPYNPAASPPISAGYSMSRPLASPSGHSIYHNTRYSQPPPPPGGPALQYNPNNYAPISSPPPNQASFPQNQYSGYGSQSASQQSYMPPPPPPPGPPPAAQPEYHNPYAPQQPKPAGQGSSQSNSNDPWAGLSGWK